MRRREETGPVGYSRAALAPPVDPTNTISYNNIFNYGLTNHDLGGIYICCDADGTGGSIDHNWVHDSGVRYGPDMFEGSGIQFDNQTHNMTVTHNDLNNTIAEGILVNGANSNQTEPANDMVLENNTLGAGIGTSIDFNWSDDGTGNVAENNLEYTAPAIPSSVTTATNLQSSTPGFRDITQPDLRLTGSSPAVNAGTSITGVTTNAVGTPDIGAHEYAGEDWAPGCGLPGCSFPDDAADSIDDSSSSVTYSGSGWTHCSSDCGSGYSNYNNATLYGGTISTDTTAGDSATVTFTGVQAQLYGLVGLGGLGTVSVDGGPPTLVNFQDHDWIGDDLLYTTPLLASGTHTLVLTNLGESRYYNEDSESVD